MGNQQSPPVTEASGPMTRPRKPKNGNFIEQIVQTTDRVIRNNKEIIKELNLILKQISGHRLAVNVSQTVASGGAVTGAVMAFTPLFPLGVGLLIGSAVMGGSTAIGDAVVTSNKAKEAARIVELGEDDMKELEEQLKFLSDSVEEIRKEVAKRNSGDHTGDADVAFTVLVQTIIREGLSGQSDVRNIVPKIVVSISGIAGKTGAGAFRLALAADDFVIPVVRVIGMAGIKIAPGALKVVSGVLGAVGAAVDVGITIAGWVMQNPTAEQVKKVIDEIEVRIEELEEMKRCFDKVKSAINRERSLGGGTNVRGISG